MDGDTAKKSKSASYLRSAKCQHCQKEFTSRLRNGKWTKFCQIQCYWDYSKERKWVQRECVHCGKEFKARRSYVERGQYRCCSTKCRQAANRKGMDPALCRRVCETCGQVFSVSPGEFLTGKTRRHCSKPCSRRRKMMHCEYCGQEFETKLALASKRRYCSRSCYHRSRLRSRPALLIYEILKDYGITFEEEHPLGGETNKTKMVHVDFWLSGLGIALEFDGSYWHDQKRNIRAENRKARLVKEAGLRLVRVRWEDIEQNPEISLLRIILRALQDTTPL